MSDIIKLRNKATGEIIQIRRKTPSVSPTKSVEKPGAMQLLKSRENRVEKSITDRGNRLENIKSDLLATNPIRKVMGGLQVMDTPRAAFEAGLANPLLDMQKGIINPSVLIKDSIAGFKGQRQGEFGDPYRIAGFPEPIPTAMGMTLGFASPAKLLLNVKKSISGISKMSDKGILRAGDNLIKATDEAIKYSGNELNKAFSAVDTIKVDAGKVIDNVTKLPKGLIDAIEESVGNLSDIGNQMTVGHLRRIKQVVGKYKPTIFGKGERGVAENLEADKINNVYSFFKKELKDSVGKNTDSKTANNLMKMEEKYTDIQRSTDAVKKYTVDPTLRKPTKAGRVAKKVEEEGDVTGRVALNTIRENGGKEAKKLINKAVSDLEAFNRWRRNAEIASHVVKAGLYGGAIGGLGGYLAGKIYSRDSN